MNEVNKTMYIPLYGKAQISKAGIILQDKKAEKIWEQEGFELKGKSKSKWLSYYMGMRAWVFDTWVERRLENVPEAAILHIGCGMDSRVERVQWNPERHQWLDIDFSVVIEERKKYYQEGNGYQMIMANVSQIEWITQLPTAKQAIVIMEGISMYLTPLELQQLFVALQSHYPQVQLLVDCYTIFGAKASKYKNPINDVGVEQVYGIDNPEELVVNGGIRFIQEMEMAPSEKIMELPKKERGFFRRMFVGGIAKKMYRLYEYEFKNIAL